MNRLAFYRYLLEIISVPIFAFLVVHVGGEGLVLLLEGEAHHAHDHHHHHGGYELYLAGILVLILFAWIWHRPFMKRLVPCSHEHCHHQNIWTHLGASAAFVFHFFPESGLRYQMMADFSAESLMNVIEAIGFGSHFLIDILIAVMLSSFWPRTWQKVLSLVLFIGFWILAFEIGSGGDLHLPGTVDALGRLVSAFLLAMFVHKPHKPKPVCTQYDPS